MPPKMPPRAPRCQRILRYGVGHRLDENYMIHSALLTLLDAVGFSWKRKWRLGSELNRRTRLCRPLHNHSATQPHNETGRRVRRLPENLERARRLELPTSTLARLRSTN